MSMMDSLLQLPLNEVPLTFLDVETTGLSPSLGDRVIEIALLQVQGTEVKHFDTLINPERSLNPKAMKVNGITPSMLANAPKFNQVIPELNPLLTNTLIVGHNIKFDMDFLEAEYFIANAKLPKSHFLDTLTVAKKQYSFPKNNLEYIANELGIVADQFHRAMSDVLVTYEVFQFFVNNLKISTVKDWMNYQGRTAWKSSSSNSAVSPSYNSALSTEELLKVALANQQLIEVEYLSSKGEVTQRKLKPSSLNGNKVGAYCFLRKKFQTFQVDKILRAELV